MNLSDDEFVAALCSAVLDGAAGSETTGRAKYQIAMTVCQRCRQGWQEGAGAQVAIEPAVTERAMCAAQQIGSIDGAAPERAHQDIPPSTVRLVWRRDGGRCRVPGCRSARGLEIHHIVHRADGGSHDASNLCLLCSACHLAHHRGALAISGTAAQLEVRRPGEALQADTVRDLRSSASATTPIVTMRADTHVHACDAGRNGASGSSREAASPTMVSAADAAAHVAHPTRTRWL